MKHMHLDIIRQKLINILTKELRRKTMYFIKDGNKFFQSRNVPEVSTVLPKGIYVMKQTPEGQFYLEEYDTFTVPSKVYGDCSHQKQCIFRAYEASSNSVGISLQGFLGSGKTMLAKIVANEFIERYDNGVVILINDVYCSTSFYQFLCNISQDHMLLFEEFDKLYCARKEIADATLTLFDGIFSRKRLIVTTSNDPLPSFFMQRPSRILYNFKFKSIPSSIISEICSDLDVQEIDVALCSLNALYEFNFDSVFAIIKEYKLSGNRLDVILEYLNAVPGSFANNQYEIESCTVTNKEGKILKNFEVKMGRTYNSIDGMQISVRELITRDQAAAKSTSKVEDDDDDWGYDDNDNSGTKLAYTNVRYITCGLSDIISIDDDDICYSISRHYDPQLDGFESKEITILFTVNKKEEGVSIAHLV